MKIIGKAIISLFLVAVVLTSCSSLVSTATTSPTDAMETALALAWTAVAEPQTAVPIATLSPQLPTPISPTPLPPTPTPFFSFPVDRHDPESVIRAFFDAFVRKDGIAMASIEGRSYVTYIFDDPIVSIRILEIQPLSSQSPNKRVYSVLFDIQMEKGQEEHNLHNGQMLWKFILTWDADHDSWFVTNHGFG